MLFCSIFMNIVPLVANCVKEKTKGSVGRVAFSGRGAGTLQKWSAGQGGKSSGGLQVLFHGQNNMTLPAPQRSVCMGKELGDSLPVVVAQLLQPRVG